MFNVYYRNRNSGRICRYCVAAMSKPIAVRMRDRFNALYPNKRYPNGKGWYPFTKAWVDKH